MCNRDHYGVRLRMKRAFGGALEPPVKYLTAFIAFAQIGLMVVPMASTTHFIEPAWKGAAIISFMWFLYRWKENFVTRALGAMPVESVDRTELLTLDKLSSVGLFVVGGLAFAETIEVAMRSLITIGGIGAVATTFAGRGILGECMNGLNVLLSQVFSIGDTIKVGSIEGEVIKMGFTTITLLNAEKFHMAIINRSQVEWWDMASKIPVQIDDGKIRQISEEILSMMKSNVDVFLGEEQPYCYSFPVEESIFELSIGYSLKLMSKDKLYAAEQDVLLQCVEIIEKHGATLASTREAKWFDLTRLDLDSRNMW